MVAQGQFREDLYYRLSTFPIHLPPLRERGSDIALLATSLLARVAPQRKLFLSDSALEQLRTQNYPGNVRELRNLLERSALLCDGDTLEASHVTQALQSGRRSRLATTPGLAGSSPVDNNTSPNGTPARLTTTAQTPTHGVVPGALAAVAQAALKEIALAHTGSRVELAARLGISERTLYRKLKALKLA